MNPETLRFDASVDSRMQYDTFESSEAEKRGFSFKKWLNSLFCCCCRKSDDEIEVVIRRVKVRSRMRTKSQEEEEESVPRRAGGFYEIFGGDRQANE